MSNARRARQQHAIANAIIGALECFTPDDLSRLADSIVDDADVIHATTSDRHPSWAIVCAMFVSDERLNDALRQVLHLRARGRDGN